MKPKNTLRFFILMATLWPSLLFSSYTAGMSISIGSMGKDISLGLTLHNLIHNKYIFNVYGFWDYRFWGHESWKPTGSIGIGFGYWKNLINLKKPIYWDKKNKKYFKSLGIGITGDFIQKFSRNSYVGGQYGGTVWGRLNSQLLGLGLGLDYTRGLGFGMHGRLHYGILFW